MTNIARNKGNWDVKFYNITYEKAKEINEDKNIKEISLIHKKGISESVSDTPFGSTKLDLREYDKKALLNAKLDILEGRLPETPNEIVIKKREGDFLTNINDKIELNINGDTLEYTVVGLAKIIDFDKITFGDSIYGAVTCLDEKVLENNSQVDIFVITNNIQKTYKTVERIVFNNKELNFKEKLNEEKMRF